MPSPAPRSSPTSSTGAGTEASLATSPAEKPSKSDTDGKTSDRLPTTLDELKETKGGFVAFHFLTGKDKDAIAKDLTASFKLAEPQTAKIARRIIGCACLYAPVFELVPAKK